MDIWKMMISLRENEKVLILKKYWIQLIQFLSAQYFKTYKRSVLRLDIIRVNHFNLKTYLSSSFSFRKHVKASGFIIGSRNKTRSDSSGLHYFVNIDPDYFVVVRVIYGPRTWGCVAQYLELRRYLDWFSALPYVFIIFICSFILSYSNLFCKIIRIKKFITFF